MIAKPEMRKASFEQIARKTIVVFSGFNQRAVIAFIRTLTKNGLDFSIVALSEDDPILLTEYKDRVSVVRNDKKLEINDLTRCLHIVKEQNNVDELFIVPSTEALNRFLLCNRKVFESIGCSIPLVDEDLYYRISDKKPFCDLCSKYGINVPREVEFNESSIPFVVKPKRYDLAGALSSPIIVDSKQVYDSLQFNERNSYCQEFLSGKSYYLLYYISKDKTVHRLLQENLVQQPFGKSIIAARILQDTLDDEKFVNMFLSEGYYGLVMVEIRIVDGQLYMIEANPRLWGPSQLFVDFGDNLFDCFLEDNGFEVIHNAQIDTNALYYWNGGMSGNVVYHNKTDFNFALFIEHDIYKREDTLGIYKQELIERLIADYNNVSKHSQYQILPERLAMFVDQSNLRVKSRTEKERLGYVLKKVDLKGKTVVDIGGNTGYFSFESLNSGVEFVTVYEGNQTHADFINTAIDLLDVRDKMEVVNSYYTFKECAKYDVCFLLNVLHHLGDDYGDNMLSIEEAKRQMIVQLNNMALISKEIVFQMGFNWHGNRNRCLFANGTKKELIDFVELGVSEYWEIESIGIAEKCAGVVVYCDLDDHNIERDDTVGEFLNRPLFIMKSKVLRD